MLKEGIYNKSVAVIIPCYKVEKHIKKVVEELPDNVDYIILVNDASPDNTPQVLIEIEAENKKVIICNHLKNQGVGGAMITGFKNAIELNVDVVVKLDGDGQMDSKYISVLVKALAEEDYDFSKGNRFYDLGMLRKMPLMRRIGNLGLSFLIKIASGYWNIFDPSNGFICIKTSYLKRMDLDSLAKRYFFESSLLIALYYTGAKIKDIPMPARYGDEKSNLSVTKTLFSFPPKLFKAFMRRISLRYFIYDFNINSLYILFGTPLSLFGIIFGIIKWISYASQDIPAPTGTIMIAVLSVVLGFQMLLSAIQYDITSKNPFQNNARDIDEEY